MEKTELLTVAPAPYAEEEVALEAESRSHREGFIERPRLEPGHIVTGGHQRTRPIDQG